MTRKYFGTDGVRGRVGKAPMTPEFALKLGWAAGRVLARTQGARVLIGKDTRRSGYMFESALEAGFAAAGVETYLTGPLPTPAVAYLTRALRAQAGIVISASHNPHFDNGVKFFSADGNKLSDEIEEEIELQLEQELICVPSEQLGRARRIDDAPGRYIEFCKGAFGRHSLQGLRIVLDCANGAAYRVAPAVMRELGADLIVLGDQPNGLNINADCGSTHLQGLRTAVLQHQAHIGIALDGDGDRCLMVDEQGREVDGDQILYIIVARRLALGGLRGPVVGTVMSNLGLERALNALDIRFERTAVGDRHVLERLKQSNGVLGGEASGHTICLDRASTGDGIVTALQVLEAMLASGSALGTLLSGLHKFPQVLVNVPVHGDARPILELPGVLSALKGTERRLQGRGRVLLRASGTESLIRVMVEAEDARETQEAADELAEAVRCAAVAAEAA